jgi:hypothetical protein
MGIQLLLIKEVSLAVIVSHCRRKEDVIAGFADAISEKVVVGDTAEGDPRQAARGTACQCS